MTAAQNDLPIGVFDSGVGGLTVLKALRERLPAEDLVYLGDTARLPYGTKSARSILGYASQAAAHLQARQIKLLVVACNTASAVALDHLRETLAPLPVIGVVEPGAAAAAAASPAGRHLVLATEATVALQAYSDAIMRLDSSANVREMPCEMLVAQAEEGWTSGATARAIVSEYLAPVLTDEAARPQVLILGCTHFPILRDVIKDVAGDGITIVDSAGTTAEQVAEFLDANALGNQRQEGGSMRLLATDGARRFARVGGDFLDMPLSPDDVELIDL